MPKKLSRENLEHYRQLEARGKVGVRDFPSKSAYNAFRNWQKRQKVNGKRQAGKKPIPKHLTQPPEDLSPFFPQWQSMTELERDFYRAGYAASLDCAASGHNMQAWKAFAKAGAPDQFGDRDRKQTFTPQDYKDMVEHLFIGDGDDDGVILRLIAAHMEQNGGSADPEFIATLVSSMQKSE